MDPSSALRAPSPTRGEGHRAESPQSGFLLPLWEKVDRAKRETDEGSISQRRVADPPCQWAFATGDGGIVNPRRLTLGGRFTMLRLLRPAPDLKALNETRHC